MFQTPILFLVFNRPETTKLVFAKIREMQPKQLFVAADGPRLEKEGEIEKTDSVRKYVLENIDWPCEVKTLFRKDNLGCGLAVSQAITWFFEHVEQGIILEDDCLPDLSFFRFCEELLLKYYHNTNIVHVGGSNFQPRNSEYKGSYYYSKYPHIWGWATWKRAWNKYDYNLSKANYKQLFKDLLMFKNERTYWMDLMDEVQKGNYSHNWDAQWMIQTLAYQKITIVPSRNLISNIGFDSNATHTVSPNSFLQKFADEMNFPLIINDKFATDESKDLIFYKNTFYQWRNKNKLELLFNQFQYYFNRIISLFLKPR